jgi:polar amino acid transport system substrate-binding protein
MPTKIISTLAIIAGASLLALASTASADVLDNIKKAGKVRIAVAMGIPE